MKLLDNSLTRLLRSVLSMLTRTIFIDQEMMRAYTPRLTGVSALSRARAVKRIMASLKSTNGYRHQSMINEVL